MSDTAPPETPPTDDSGSRGTGGPGKYRIGTVATLTGLSTHTIRAWERRHGVVSPTRSPSGLRLYGDADVSRLQLLRALTECGEAIGEIASLRESDLRARLARHAAPPRTPRPRSERVGPVRALLLDLPLAEQLALAAADAGDLQVVASLDSREALEAHLAREPVDVVIAGLEQLGEPPAEAVERLAGLAPDAPILVLYGYATRSRLAHLASRGAHLLKRPANAAAVRRAVTDARAIHGALGRTRRPPPPPLRAAEPPTPAPARLFDDHQLAMLQETRSSVDCECPNHLSAIVGSLVAFERYSRECESKSPEDAQLHATLAEGTARARVVMERVLVHLCEEDDLPVGLPSEAEQAEDDEAPA